MGVNPFSFPNILFDSSDDGSVFIKKLAFLPIMESNFMSPRDIIKESNVVNPIPFFKRL